MEFIKNNFFNLIGIASFIIGMLAFLDGRSSKKQTEDRREVEDYIYKTAFKNMDAEITKEQIEELKHYKSELQDTIENKLPQIAKKSNIKNKIVFLKEQIIKNYNEYEKLCKELQNYEDIKLPDNIVKIISDKLLSEEIKKREHEKNIILLLVIFVSYIITNNLPIIENFSILFLIPIYKPISYLSEFYLTNIKNVRNKICYIFNIIFASYIFIYSFFTIESLTKSSTFFGMGMKKTVLHNFTWMFFIDSIISIISFAWLVTSLMLLLKDFFKQFYPKRIKKKNKIILYMTIYLFLIILFFNNIVTITKTIQISSENELVIWGSYEQLQLVIVSILFSMFTMIIIPILSIRK